MAFFVGVSHDDGKTWKFVSVTSSYLMPNEIELIFPAARNVPRPELIEFVVSAPAYEWSRWLRTTMRQFVPVGGGFAYALRFDVRRETDEPLDLIVRYENPEDPGQPLFLQSSLPPGQREIDWQSPPMTGFDLGENYSIVVEAADPATGKQIFEHRETVPFLPTIEMWRDHLSKPPVE